jgi:hypothetical protein
MIALIVKLPLFIQAIAMGLIGLGVLCFSVQIAIILKQRARKQNDYWVKNIIFSLVCLSASIISCIFYFVSGKSMMGILAGVLFFFGFLLPFIIGHIYKILPFLIWYERFAPLVGKQKVPLLHQMIHTKVADAQTWILFVSVFMLSGGVLMQVEKLFFIGSVLLLVSLILVAFNAVYVFNYKIKEND